MSSSLSAARFPTLPLRQEAVEVRPEKPVAPREGPSDDALIAQICTDDSDALGLLFGRYARLVWTIAYRILRNKEEADDLLQDLFLLVRKRASVFDPTKGSVRSLLVRMTYQRALSRRRDLVRRNFYGSLDVAETTKHSVSNPPYEESLEACFGRVALQKALDSLSEEQLATLKFCFGEGYTIEEAATRLGTSVGNARHHYYRGLAKLRKRLVAK
jgi:RNA polymerase sigma-70 factor (ECF subfamily)